MTIKMNNFDAEFEVKVRPMRKYKKCRTRKKHKISTKTEYNFRHEINYTDDTEKKVIELNVPYVDGSITRMIERFVFNFNVLMKPYKGKKVFIYTDESLIQLVRADKKLFFKRSGLTIVTPDKVYVVNYDFGKRDFVGGIILYEFKRIKRADVDNDTVMSNVDGFPTVQYYSKNQDIVMVNMDSNFIKELMGVDGENCGMIKVTTVGYVADKNSTSYKNELAIYDTEELKLSNYHCYEINKMFRFAHLYYKAVAVL